MPTAGQAAKALFSRKKKAEDSDEEEPAAFEKSEEEELEYAGGVHYGSAGSEVQKRRKERYGY